MMAITLRNPPALWVKLGWKTIETRSRPTSYRGLLLITAGKNLADAAEDHCDPLLCWHVAAPDRYFLGDGHIDDEGRAGYLTPRGVAVATAQLVDCLPILELTRSRQALAADVEHVWVGPRRLAIWRRDAPTWQAIDSQRQFGDFVDGNFAYVLEDVQLTDPIPVTGRQGTPLWSPDRATVDAINATRAQ